MLHHELNERNSYSKCQTALTLNAYTVQKIICNSFTVVGNYFIKTDSLTLTKVLVTESGTPGKCMSNRYISPPPIVKWAILRTEKHARTHTRVRSELRCVSTDDVCNKWNKDKNTSRRYQQKLILLCWKMKSRRSYGRHAVSRLSRLYSDCWLVFF